MAYVIEVNPSEISKIQAETAAQNASTSATAAATSEANVTSTIDAAVTTATATASTHATNASTSATAAATSATNAASSASAASASAISAATSQTNSATSETNAANSASAANVAAQSVTEYNYATCALMRADLTPADQKKALVYNDTTRAGSNTYTITTNCVAGDTITFDGVTFTAVSSGATGNQFNVGSSTTETATNIANAMDSNSTINAIYTVTSNSSIVTITETTAGNGNTPGAITKTGTIVVTAGTATTSTSNGIYIKQGATGTGSWLKSNYQPLVDNATNSTNSGLLYIASMLAYSTGTGATITFKNINTATIQYTAGTATGTVYVARFKIAEKVANLIGATIYIKTENNNTDTSTDIINSGYSIGFSKTSNQYWSTHYNIVSFNTCLDGYTLSGDTLRTALLAAGLVDTDPCYVALVNSGAYYAQTPYSCNKSMQCVVNKSNNMVFANIASKAIAANAATIADTATSADIAINASNAGLIDKASALAASQGTGATITFSDLNTVNITYAVGSATSTVYFGRFALCAILDLKDSPVYITTKNNNTDTATDITDAGYKVGFQAVNSGQWSNIKQSILFTDCLTGYSLSGSDLRTTLLAAGYTDTDTCYVQLYNSGAYYAQTPYSCNKSMQCVVGNPTSIILAKSADKIGQYSADDIADIVTEMNPNYITFWGDSLTALAGWTTTLATAFGMTGYNAGTGGETVRTITARQGADVMLANNITIPSTTTSVVVATMAGGGIDTEFGYKATPLLQTANNHINPCKIGDIDGTLAWTGSSSTDQTGTWTFTRSVAGDVTTITRPTAIRTAYDMTKNSPYLMTIFMGQNGGYDSDYNVLVNMHKLMIEHTNAKHVIVLGLSSGTAESRADYESAMKTAFGRYFISLRQYLAHPIYDTDGITIISCYGLSDAGLTPTADDLAKIAVGQVPLQLLLDGTHYTEACKTVIGNMLVNKCKELNIL